MDLLAPNSGEEYQMMYSINVLNGISINNVPTAVRRYRTEVLSVQEGYTCHHKWGRVVGIL